jgi:phage regulator Rha-like protein
MKTSRVTIPATQIEKSILLIRNERVMLDSDLAKLYEVETKILNRAVKRNLSRFPVDFMFQLNTEETEALRFHFGTSKAKGGRRYRPYVFTEQGVAMLSSVLNSERAVLVNIAIVRTFVKLRSVIASHSELSQKLAELERKYDDQFRVVFDAIRQLMTVPPPKRKQIGFRPKLDKTSS